MLVSRVGLLRWVAAGNGSVAEFKLCLGLEISKGEQEFKETTTGSRQPSDARYSRNQRVARPSGVPSVTGLFQNLPHDERLYLCKPPY